ncbi:hypothetical protein R5W24_002869 [Gemmata sp. JC717]|uniref:Uncharacterized protein n=1 Tax=Gemmata algarum TaxID=2975278 RepID=A0ABU5ER86_9BACT|nr:hypothetical protein [Gemmata algarum]MDY3553755.1 hypothetical protein [Gemmata algarum]MDY3557581.1 hypothetical protein [Gemmata algarum]
MSLTELLPAIRALSRAEQVQLLHLLVDGVADTPAPIPQRARTDDGVIPDALRTLIPQTAELWFPEANPSAAAGAARVLQEGRDGG